MTLPKVAPDNPLPVLLPASAGSLSADLALAAVVTREGELARVEILRSSAGSDELEEDLFRLASQIRFSPALSGGLPVAVNIVWLLEQTTVRGDAPPPVS